MFARVYSILFAAASFALLASAAPLSNHVNAGNTGVSAYGNSVHARDTTTYTTSYTSTVVEVFKTWQTTVTKSVSTMDGKVNPAGAISDIETATYTCIDAAAKIDVSIVTVVDVHAIIAIVVSVISSILIALTRYSLLIVLGLIAKLDLVISLLVKALLRLSTDIVAGVAAGLVANLGVFTSFKLVLTIAAFGFKTVSV